MYKNLVGILVCLLSVSCVGSKQITLLQQAQIQATNFYEEIPFRYVKDHIFIDVQIEGQTYNFLFDTGFTLSFMDDDLLSQVDFQTAFRANVSGSSFAKHKVKFGTLAKLKIANIEFRDIGLGVEDLSYINDDYICEDKVDGVIGANLLRKTKWQIDYQNNRIRFTDDFTKLKVDPAAIVLNMSAHQGGYGYGKVQLKLDGIEMDFIFDTGSSGAFTAGIEAWDEFQQLEPEFVTRHFGNEQEGKALVSNHIVHIEKLTIGSLGIENAVLSLEQGASSLLGNGFLQHYQVSMDWDHNQLYLVPISAHQALPIRGFDLLLRADFQTNTLFIGGKRSGTEYKNLKLGTQVLSINGEDVSQFDRAQLCAFWQNRWPQFKALEQITLELSDHPTPIILKQKVQLNLP